MPPKKTGGPVSDHKLEPVNDTANDLLAGLTCDIPDMRAHQTMLEKLVKKKEEADKASIQRAQQREQFAKQAEQRAKEAALDDGALNQIDALKNQIKLMGSQEFLEDEQVLFPVISVEPKLELDDAFIQQVEESMTELGFDAAMLASHGQHSKSDNSSFVTDTFKTHVLSGFLKAELLNKGKCSEETAAALYALLAQSPDVQLAGAAFTTLLVLMGDSSLSGLSLEALSLFSIPGGKPEGKHQQQQEVKFEWLPSDVDIVAALKSNGFNAKSSSKKSKDTNSDEGAELRLQTIKLLLHTAAALCRFNSNNAKKVKTSIISREGISELICSVLHMGIDPSAVRIQEDLDSVLPDFLKALHEDDWQRILPNLAERVSNLGPTPKAHLRVLKFIPTESSRGLELQQLAGCMLLERIIPSKKGQSKSVVPRRGGLPNPADVIAAQFWFDDVKGLINGATSGGAGPAAARGGYLIGHVELLLVTCHTVLWPHMLHHEDNSTTGHDAMDTDTDDVIGGGGEKSSKELALVPLSSEFLDEWIRFLAMIAKNIKTLQAEDQFVRGLACQLEMEYRNGKSRAAEKVLGLGSP